LFSFCFVILELNHLYDGKQMIIPYSELCFFSMSSFSLSQMSRTEGRLNYAMVRKGVMKWNEIAGKWIVLSGNNY